MPRRSSAGHGSSPPARQANNALLDLEEMDDKELDRIRETYLVLAREQRERNG